MLVVVAGVMRCVVAAPATHCAGATVGATGVTWAHDVPTRLTVNRAVTEVDLASTRPASGPTEPARQGGGDRHRGVRRAAVGPGRARHVRHARRGGGQHDRRRGDHTVGARRLRHRGRHRLHRHARDARQRHDERRRGVRVARPPGRQRGRPRHAGARERRRHRDGLGRRRRIRAGRAPGRVQRVRDARRRGRGDVVRRDRTVHALRRRDRGRRRVDLSCTIRRWR